MSTFLSKHIGSYNRIIQQNPQNIKVFLIFSEDKKVARYIWGSRGREFKSRHSDQETDSLWESVFLISICLRNSRPLAARFARVSIQRPFGRTRRPAPLCGRTFSFRVRPPYVFLFEASSRRRYAGRSLSGSISFYPSESPPPRAAWSRRRCCREKSHKAYVGSGSPSRSATRECREESGP